MDITFRSNCVTREGLEGVAYATALFAKIFDAIKFNRRVKEFYIHVVDGPNKFAVGTLNIKLVDHSGDVRKLISFIGNQFEVDGRMCEMHDTADILETLGVRLVQ